MEGLQHERKKAELGRNRDIKKRKTPKKLYVKEIIHCTEFVFLFFILPDVWDDLR